MVFNLDFTTVSAPKKYKVLERTLAARYFAGGQGRVAGSRFVRFVIVAATAGVAVGVAALLLALSITRGFSQEIERKILDFGAHVQVESFLDSPLEGSSQYAEALAGIEGVVTVEPSIIEFALIRTRTDIDGIALWGTPEARMLSGYMEEGRFTARDEQSGKPGIVISRAQADLLNVGLGGLVTCFSVRENRSIESSDILFGRPRVQQFTVTGIYDTGFAEVDDRFAFVDIATARRLLGYGPDQTTRFDVRVADIAMVDSVVSRIERTIGFPTLSRTVFEVHRNLFAWVGLQESIIPLIIMIIILVAAFNIVGTLLMLVLEKTGEIGTLRSMGATIGQIRGAFVWLGIWIGAVGIAVGEGIALLLAVAQDRYGIIPLPRETYYMDTAPVVLSVPDFVLVASVAMALCLLAAYVPAKVAAAVDPIKTIRFAG
jgi:lipoprotein-releasing system permease protein